MVCLQYMNNENIKCLFAIHKLWKNENTCCQYMNYENICCQYMNNEKMKIFVWNTWIMKIFCLQYMKYENMKMFVCNTWIMKTENIIL